LKTPLTQTKNNHARSLKHIFAQGKIILEGTLILSHLKMINTMSTLPPPGKSSADAHDWSCFLALFFS